MLAELKPLLDWLGEGTAPQYGTFLVLAAMAVGLWIKLRLGVGDIDVKADQVRVEQTKADDEADAALRTHFGQELERLANMARTAVEELEKAKERQRACEDREEKLRIRVRKLEDKMTGIVRSLAVEGSLRVLDITEHPSDDIIKAAISSLENIIAKRAREEAGKSGD